MAWLVLFPGFYRNHRPCQQSVLCISKHHTSPYRMHHTVLPRCCPGSTAWMCIRLRTCKVCILLSAIIGQYAHCRCGCLADGEPDATNSLWQPSAERQHQQAVLYKVAKDEVHARAVFRSLLAADCLLPVVKITRDDFNFAALEQLAEADVPVLTYLMEEGVFGGEALVATVRSMITRLDGEAALHGLGAACLSRRSITWPISSSYVVATPRAGWRSSGATL